MVGDAQLGIRWDHEGRRAERLGVQMKAALRASGWGKFDVNVSDMSVVGFRFDTASNLNVGERVWLSIPGLAALESLVVWRSRHHYGCEFVIPLHVAVLDHVVRQFRKPV
jgi:hypothetical protein